MSKVRVLAKDEDGGGGVIVIYPSPRDPKENPDMTDAEWYDYACVETAKTFKDFTGPHVDLDNGELPPLDTQSNWRIVGGRVINAS